MAASGDNEKDVEKVDGGDTGISNGGDGDGTPSGGGAARAREYNIWESGLD